jgi:hypothetical protein
MMEHLAIIKWSNYFVDFFADDLLDLTLLPMSLSFFLGVIAF